MNFQPCRDDAMKVMRVLLAVGWLLGAGVIAAAAPAGGGNLLGNGGFEQGTGGWDDLWTRTAGAGRAVLETGAVHGGGHAVRIEHGGSRDWSFGHSLTLDVKPGEVFEFSAWVRLQGEGRATLSVVTRDAAGQPVDWIYAGRSTAATAEWRLLRSRFVVPPGVATIKPRLIGEGPATVWCDDVALVRQDGGAARRRPGLPPELTIRNAALAVTFHMADATFSMQDLRNGRTWAQQASGGALTVLDARASGAALAVTLFDPVSGRDLTVRAQLDGAAPELVVGIRGEGAMDGELSWPAPVAAAAGQRLILPMNEGISYPVDDASLPAMRFQLYSGHGLCMPWYGAMAADGAGWMAIVETPDDASAAVPRSGGLLVLSPVWEPQKQAFGPERVIRYVILDRGGYVAMAKRYRGHAQKTGLFKTLEEKRKTVPATDLLVGAVNIWCWEPNAADWCRELQAAGIRRILWSNALPPDQIRALNGMGVLTSRYDLYQDAMNPAEFPRLQYRHPDWTSDAWANDDLMVGADGGWVRGWEVETKDGGMLPCGTLCDRQAVAYARQRIPAELATHPYRCRFVDTTTASPWRECYNPKHPMTRSESKFCKMQLLRCVSEEYGLVCGSETGHDAAVPYAHYFEGMLSLAPYRVPDSGRAMMRIWHEVPGDVAKFQTGHAYRLPLWELVYHDCLAAHWYWGDYNNKLPALWDRRDLWNCLYGTAPMFMFDRKLWEENRDRFVKSYQTTAPVARATGYAEMLSHEWLTPDHAVQRTRFANGVTVTVNFGAAAWTAPDGATLPPLGSRVEGLPVP